MNKTILSILAIMSVLTVSSVYATSSFSEPEHIGAQDWIFDQRTGVFSNAGGQKIVFPDEKFVPSEGKVDTITFYTLGDSSQVAQFGVKDAYVYAYQNIAHMVLNGKYVKSVLVEPSQSFSIEFDGDLVVFHSNGQSIHEGKLDSSNVGKTPFLKCSTDVPCASGVAKTTNER